MQNLHRRFDNVEISQNFVAFSEYMNFNSFHGNYSIYEVKNCHNAETMHMKISTSFIFQKELFPGKLVAEIWYTKRHFRRTCKSLMKAIHILECFKFCCFGPGSLHQIYVNATPKSFCLHCELRS